MKLAIIMSGMLRNFEHTFFSTKKFLLEDKFFEKKDIFFYGYSDNFELDESIKKFEKLYKPKKFKIEKWNENIKNSIEMTTASNKWPKFHTASPVTNIMSSWRCRYLANEFKIEFEKVNKFKYDLVYQLRTDLFCFDYIDHKFALKASKEKNCVYVPKDWDHKDADPIAIGDIMAYGSSKAMNNYFSLYKNAKRYWLKGIKGHPETILGYHFEDKKIIRKFCERNVAREYPYTIPTYDYLWLKWPKDQVKKDLGIDDEFLSNERKKYKINNKFFKFIMNFKKSILTKIILQALKKFFKLKINRLVTKFNIKFK